MSYNKGEYGTPTNPSVLNYFTTYFSLGFMPEQRTETLIVLAVDLWWMEGPPWSLKTFDIID